MSHHMIPQRSKAKPYSEREQRFRENYRHQRSLYMEMKGLRDHWQRRALEAEAELKALRETLLRLGVGARP